MCLSSRDKCFQMGCRVRLRPIWWASLIPAEIISISARSVTSGCGLLESHGSLFSGVQREAIYHQFENPKGLASGRTAA